MSVLAWRCRVCRTTVDIATPHPFRCPKASASDPHHVLHPLVGGPVPDRLDDANPFVAYGPRLAWWAFARAHGMTEAACVALTRDVAAGFTVTPFVHEPSLSDVCRTNVWVKDETGNVGGSHKGRHLVTILLHLRAAEALGLAEHSRRPLAIASCGNAAIAAATLAQRAEWPLEVYVPDWARRRRARPAGRPRGDRHACARGAPTTRREIRRSCASARRWRPGRSRSACRGRRTRCASTVGARSAGRWPT